MCATRSTDKNKAMNLVPLLSCSDISDKIIMLFWRSDVIFLRYTCLERMIVQHRLFTLKSGVNDVG